MKADKDFTVIVLPDATMQELVEFKEKFNQMRKQPDFSPILTSSDTKIFKIIKGEIFEIVTSLEKVKGVRIPRVTNMMLSWELPKQPKCMYKIGSVA